MDRERFKEGLMAYITDPKKEIAKLMYYAKERKVVKKVQNMIGVWLYMEQNLLSKKML